jgi:hypothetical protein
MDKGTYFVADEITAKILLLFVFEKMEIPLSENTLTEIITANPDWLSYMDYRIALAGIQESKLVVTKIVSGEMLYQLTEDGRKCLSLFFAKIPASIREQIISYTRENKLRMKHNQEYRFNYYKNKDGTYTAVLTIKDNVSPTELMDIKITVPTRMDALRASKQWKDKAPEVFETIWEMLVEKETETHEGGNKNAN